MIVKETSEAFLKLDSQARFSSFTTRDLNFNSDEIEKNLKNVDLRLDVHTFDLP